MNNEYMAIETEILEQAERLSLAFERDSRRYGGTVDTEREAAG